MLPWIAGSLLALQTSPGVVAPDLAEQWRRRDAWQQPERVIEVLHLHAGDVVADLGAGYGYFTQYLARAVGPSGRVLALDVNSIALAVNESLAVQSGLTNVEFRVVAYDNPGLETGEAGLIFVCNSWHLFQDRLRYATTLREALRPEQRLAVIGSGLASVPRGDFRTNRYQVRREAEAGGFVLLAEPAFLQPRAFFLVFKPGRAAIFDQMPGFRYVTSELAFGPPPPDRAALQALAERGFLQLVDLRTGAEERPEIVAAAKDLGLEYVREPIQIADDIAIGDLHRVAIHLADPKTGIVYLYAESVREAGQVLIRLYRYGVPRLTDFEAEALMDGAVQQ